MTILNHFYSCSQLSRIETIPFLLQEMTSELSTTCTDCAGVPTSSSASITNLPNEIIHEVFVILAHDWDRLAVPPLQWLVVSHVCTLWRRLALENSSLWIYISFTGNTDYSFARAQAFLDRSERAAALHICVNIPSSRLALDQKQIITMTHMLKPHLSRISWLRVHGLSKTNLILLMRLFNHPASKLRHLDISSDRYPNVLLSITEDNIPFISELKLRGLTLPWDTTILSNLTLLSLDRMRGSPTLCELLTILERCPALQALTMEGIYFSPEDDFPAHRRSPEPVQLRCLCRLSLHSEQASHVSQVLACIRFPSSATVTLRFWNTYNCEFTVPASLIDIMTEIQTLNIIGKSKFRSPGIASRLLHRFAVSVSGDNTSGGNLEMMWSFSIIACNAQNVNIPRLGTGVFTFPNTCHLNIDLTLEWFGIEDWRYLLKQLPDLVIITAIVEFEDLEKIYQALTRLEDDEMLCSKLETVTITAHVDVEEIENVPIVAQNIIKLAEQRAVEGPAFSTVLEFRARLSESDVNLQAELDSLCGGVIIHP